MQPRWSGSLPVAALVAVGAIALYEAGLRVALPFVNAVDLGGPGNLNVFALGVTPALSAFALVELVALVIPRLRPLRHVPTGRALLSRAAVFLSIVLAAAQAFGLCVQLRGLAHESPEAISSSVVETDSPLLIYGVVLPTVVAGFLVLAVACAAVTRTGLVNGFVLLAAYAAARDLVLQAMSASPLLEATAWDRARPVVGLALAAVACVVAFRSWATAGITASPGSAYRDTGARPVSMAIPIPASSIQPLAAAPAVLMLPVLLTKFGLPGTWTVGDPYYSPVQVGLTVGFALGLAWLMNQPKRVAAVAAQLGLRLEAGSEDAARALRRALVPTALCMAVLALAGVTSALSVVGVPLIVAAALDLGAAVRLRASQPSLVAIWEERRSYALPLIVEALRTRGIRAELLGRHALTALQVFGPYACARVAVAEQEAERARAILHHALAGGPAPSDVPHASDAPRPLPAPRPGTVWLGGLLVVGMAFSAAAAFVGRAARVTAEAAAAPVSLEITQVDDESDPLAKVDDEALPVGAAIFVEQVGRPRANVRYARVARSEVEPLEETEARLKVWLGTIHLPEGRRFAFEELTETDPETDVQSVIGRRTLLLKDPPVLTAADVEDARAEMDTTGRGGAYTRVQLTPEGAARFADATERSIGRRIAIVIDGRVESAPIVMSRIAGRNVQINVRSAEEAKSLAVRLRAARRGPRD